MSGTADEPAPAVLISPAMAIGSGYYGPLVQAFAARGWSASTLPRRGFERDEAPASRTKDWSYRDEIDDMAVAVARARDDVPGRPVVVLGHSLGGQLAAGLQLTREPVDGLVTVGTSLPYHRPFRFGGPQLLVMGGVLVPLSTAVLGYLPRPLFGAPGARTLMREWARMAVSARLPFAVDHPIDAPTLLVTLEGDKLAPPRAVDDFARRLFTPGVVTSWTYRDADVPEGGSNNHTYWVRRPDPVVDRIVTWWASVSSARRSRR